MKRNNDSDISTLEDLLRLKDSKSSSIITSSLSAQNVIDDDDVDFPSDDCSDENLGMHVSFKI